MTCQTLDASKLRGLVRNVKKNNTELDLSCWDEKRAYVKVGKEIDSSNLGYLGELDMSDYRKNTKRNCGGSSR